MPLAPPRPIGAQQQGQALRQPQGQSRPPGQLPAPNPYMQLATGPAQTPNTSSYLFSYAPQYEGASMLDAAMGNDNSRGGLMSMGRGPAPPGATDLRSGRGQGGSSLLDQGRAEDERIRRMQQGRV